FMTVDILIELGDLFAESDSAKAVDYYKQALTVTDEKQFHSYEETVAQKLFDFYSARKDTTEAFLYSQKLLEAYSEQEENNRREGFDYIDFALKDQQLTLAQQRSDYNARLLWLACIACVMAIAIIALLWFNSGRHRKTHQLLQKQYTKLEAISESLEKRNLQYARLLKAVAHDLRNPIGAVLSASKKMLEAPQPDGKMTRLIHQASSQCLDLIGELMETDFEFRPESLHKEPVDIKEMLQSVIGLLEFKARDKLQLIRLLPPASPITVSLDREQMRRVIDNLLVNAIKFSPSGSTITLSAEQQEEYITLKVKDEGIGIPIQVAHQLFDPFTPAKRKGTAGEPTFGLGLSICKQIVEAHGGAIWFESQEKSGTTFYVQLPRKITTTTP
ncbi:MAG TPA: HAMP domain-containing sensor histidine kinase, partial [Puia sp.]